MPVMERTEAVLPPEAMDLPDAEYPPEVIARWDKETEIAEMQIATGELKPVSVAEFAARYGIKLNGQ
jgi:hypothetical protein